jgi:hypothetical protein
MVVCMFPTQNKKMMIHHPFYHMAVINYLRKSLIACQVPKTKVEVINKFEYKMFKYISDTQLGTEIVCMLKKHHKCLIQSS